MKKLIEKGPIPKELDKRRWVIWGSPHPGAVRKQPYYASTLKPRRGKQGTSEDLSDLVTYSHAVDVANAEGFEGVGVCMIDGDGVLVVDLDKCVTVDSAGGTVLNELSRKVVDSNPGLWDISPSGQGLHGYFKGGGDVFKTPGIEIYPKNQFLTWTGNILYTVEDLTEFQEIPGHNRTERPVAISGDDWFPHAVGSQQWLDTKHALSFIDPDCDYDTWKDIAFALKNGFGDAALELFQEWSKSSDSADYPGDVATERKWLTIDPSKPGEASITLGTLFHKAKEMGYEPPKPTKDSWSLDMDPKKGSPFASDANLEKIITFDDGLPSLMFNEMYDFFEMKGEVPWNANTRRSSIIHPDVDDYAGYRRYITQAYKVTFSIPDIERVVRLMCKMSRYNPVVDMLNKIKGKWDGKKRVDSWMTEYLGTPDDDYHRECSRLLLTAAVARALEPGCVFDHVVVLEGKQGVRKSTLVRELAIIPDCYITEGNSLGSKDSMEKLKRAWFVELGELSSIKKTDVEDFKRFVSEVQDTFRGAYRRDPKPEKRRCVFVGTTNDTEYIADPTGSRRFLPVRVEVPVIDIDRFRKNLKQMYSEVLATYVMEHEAENKEDATAYRLDITDKAKDQAHTVRQARTLEHPDQAPAEAFIAEAIPRDYYKEFQDGACDTRRESITTVEITKIALGKDTISSSERFSINKMLSAIPYLVRAKDSKKHGRFGQHRYWDINWAYIKQYRQDLMDIHYNSLTSSEESDGSEYFQ